MEYYISWYLKRCFCSRLRVFSIFFVFVVFLLSEIRLRSNNEHVYLLLAHNTRVYSFKYSFYFSMNLLNFSNRNSQQFIRPSFTSCIVSCFTQNIHLKYMKEFVCDIIISKQYVLLQLCANSH